MCSKTESRTWQTQMLLRLRCIEDRHLRSPSILRWQTVLCQLIFLRRQLDSLYWGSRLNRRCRSYVGTFTTMCHLLERIICLCQCKRGKLRLTRIRRRPIIQAQLHGWFPRWTRTGRYVQNHPADIYSPSKSVWIATFLRFQSQSLLSNLDAMYQFPGELLFFLYLTKHHPHICFDAQKSQQYSLILGACLTNLRLVGAGTVPDLLDPLIYHDPAGMNVLPYPFLVTESLQL